MVATVYTDGSFLSRNRIAAYAYWIKTHKGSRQLSRVCPPDITDIALAETYAVLQAVAHTLHHFPEVTQVNLFSDSMAAVRLLSNREYKARNRQEGDAVARRLHSAFMCLLAESGVDVVLQHRKGHSREHGNGTYAHNWCDMTARATALNHLRNELRPVQGPGIGIKGIRAGV